MYLKCNPSKYYLRCERQSRTVKGCFSLSKGRRLIESRPKDKNDQDSSNDGSDGEAYQGYPKLGSREMTVWKCGLDIEIMGHICCMLVLEVDKKSLRKKFTNEQHHDSQTHHYCSQIFSVVLWYVSITKKLHQSYGVKQSLAYHWQNNWIWPYWLWPPQ